MTRQKQVYSTGEIAHLWAHQSQESARNPQGNFSYNGANLYSYRTVIAQLETTPAGIRYAFLSSESMTATTSKHVSDSRSATSHMERFYTPAFARWSGYARTIKEMVEPAIKEALDDLQEAYKPRKRAATKAAAVSAYERRRVEIQEVITAFNLEGMTTMPDLDPETVAKWTDAAKVQDELDKKRRQARAAREAQEELERKERDREDYEKWLTTGAGYCPYTFRTRGADQISIKIVDNNRTDETGAKYEILTSQGARCPLDHAVKALKFYESKRLTKDEAQNLPGQFLPYHTNGHKIPLGVFTLDSIDEAGTVKAGCHTFTAREIQRFINQWKEVLGL